MNRQEKGRVPHRNVFIGLSGGVDSSVAATLLKKQGHKITGVFIKIWSPEWIGCTSKEDRLDAMRVCAHLNIPFREIDLTKEYKREVVDYMVSEYKAGRTPNPDVMCNRKIKFGKFFDWAVSQGADFVATGHYARIAKAQNTDLSKIQTKHKTQYPKLLTTNHLLLTGIDSSKDQTYFLWTLTQRELSRTLFPVGHLTKPAVRKLAKKFGLPTAEKKDSQGLCFLGPIDVKAFLKQHIKPKRGNVLNFKGETIGTHESATFYTLGERRGFIITKKSSTDEPYYVVAKDIRNNTLIVSTNPYDSFDIRSHNYKTSPGKDEITALVNSSKKVFEIGGMSWINGAPKNSKQKLYARIRYRQQLQKCELTFKGNCKTAKVSFDCPQSGGAPGQSVVFYSGNQCLGGGIIKKSNTGY